MILVACEAVEVLLSNLNVVDDVVDDVGSLGSLGSEVIIPARTSISSLIDEVTSSILKRAVQKSVLAGC